MNPVTTTDNKPHVIFMPYSEQSHIKAMLKLAELLHHKGLQVTFLITEFVHKRFIESAGPHCLDGSPGFMFETIPITATGYQLIQSLQTDFLDPFVDLLTKLLNPPTCIISDGLMSAFTIDAGQKVGVPVMLYWTIAACGYMGFYQIQFLVEKGFAPLKDESYLTNGYLDTVIDWVPGMEGIRLKDFPITWTTDPTDPLLNASKQLNQRSHKVTHHIIHTFDALEGPIIKALSSMYTHMYTIGPLQLLLDQTPKTASSSLHKYSLLKEEPECFEWLDSKKPNSVVYASFGSTTVMSYKDLLELGWGLVNSNHYFLWIIRSDSVNGDIAVLPQDIIQHVKKRGFIANWCSQEKVLNHPSVGGFLTHCGWGSTIESLSAGVPMICWPQHMDQLTNCRYICKEWGVGVEMQGSEVNRVEVKRVVQELMGEGGRWMRYKAAEWKEKAHAAAGPNGSSSLNVDEIVKEITMLSRG